MVLFYLLTLIPLTLYLEYAASGISRYSVGRKKEDIDYLKNVKNYQNKIIEILDAEREILMRYAKSFNQFNDLLELIKKGLP
ncbi:MAG: hypothetical protein QXW86_12935 [Saccharolobus sp.]|nr:hypothetical protein [Saccharolobus shibatae]MCH4816818.1 hypothetical protein [Saccharolobus shibatae]